MYFIAKGKKLIRIYLNYLIFFEIKETAITLNPNKKNINIWVYVLFGIRAISVSI
jgi:hypothetical protein